MPGVTYSVSDMTKASIGSQGVLFPVAGATGSVTVTASYGGQTATTVITLTNYNVLTGAQSQLTGLAFSAFTQLAPDWFTYFPLRNGNTISNYCPTPYPIGARPLITVNAGGYNAPVGTVLAQYSDGSSVDLQNGTADPVSEFMTEPDGSTLVNWDVGGMSTLVTALYRGKRPK